MKRLYYLTDSVDFAGQVTKQLLRVPGFSRRRLHILGRDLAGLYSRRLPVPPPWLQKDFLRGAEHGALLGAALAALPMAGFWLFSLLPAGALSWLLVGAIIGAAGGGVYGWSRENVRIRRFHDALAAGKFLLIVDVTAHDEAAVRRLLAHLPIQPAGEDRALVPALI